MKLRDVLTKTLAAALTAAAALALIAAYDNQLAQAANEPQVRAASSGALTLSAGQTARLNVVNALLVQPEDATRGGDTNLPAVQRGTRTVTLAFDIYAPEPATDDGARAAHRFRFLRRESEDVTLRPGEGASIEISAPEGARVCAVVIGPPDARGQGDGGIEDPDILTTLEVREGGHTVFTHPGALQLPAVQHGAQGQQR